jgi:hypothetical protein
MGGRCPPRCVRIRRAVGHAARQHAGITTISPAADRIPCGRRMRKADWTTAAAAPATGTRTGLDGEHEPRPVDPGTRQPGGSLLVLIPHASMPPNPTPAPAIDCVGPVMPMRRHRTAIRLQLSNRDCHLSTGSSSQFKQRARPAVPRTHGEQSSEMETGRPRT